tara:strand:+ start:104 stop:481 length:378 start_codon:yes stop_codon:yes gene_type:complete
MNKILYTNKHKAGIKCDERFDVDLDYLTKKEFELFKILAQAVRANVEIFGFSKEYQKHYDNIPALTETSGTTHISIFARFSKKVLDVTRSECRIRYRGETKSVARLPSHCTIHNATNFTIYPRYF